MFGNIVLCIRQVSALTQSICGYRHSGSVLSDLHPQKEIEPKKQYRIKAINPDEVEFYIPFITEQILICVQSGLDIMPALEVVAKENTITNPVTLLMKQVIMRVHAGESLDVALKEVSSAVDSIPLQHTFIQLGLAFKEGGELVVPLQEISDNAQQMYQESIEEKINKLPVKATLPLLVTFAGLLLCLLSIPVIKVINYTKDSKVIQTDAK